MPKKGDIVINPKTQRPVKVGSRTWLKLVKEGIFDGTYQDPNELYEVADDTNVEEMKIELNKKLPRGKQAVRGRGKHKGKLVIRNKRMSSKDVSEYTSKIAAQAVRNNIGKLAEMDDEDIEAQLEKLILSEMMKEQQPKRKPRAKKTQQYEVANDWEPEPEPVAESSEEDEQDDEDFTADW